MRLSSRLLSIARIAGLAAAVASCSDSVGEPLKQAPNGAISLSDSVFTRGAVIRATAQVPEGFSLIPGSTTWSVVSGGATVAPVSGSDSQADVTFTGAGAVQLRASYKLRAPQTQGNLSITAPTRGLNGDVAVEAVRSLTVAAPVLDFTTLPTSLAAAGASLGGVAVSIKDARGQVLTTATDSIVIALDPTSGTAGATLLGTLRVRSTAGVASFPGLSIQRVGIGYRLIASSPTLTARDTATTTIVAGPANAGQSTLAVADTSILVGGTTTVTVTLRDQFTNAAAAVTPLPFTAAATNGTLDAFTCASGVCTATFTAANTAGTASISATISGTAISGSPRSVTVRPPPFILASNSVTVLCPDAPVGSSGTVGGVTYTRRSRAQLDSLVATKAYAELTRTCTTGVTNMAALFRDKADFNADISSWDMSAVTTMLAMFEGATTFNQSVGAWNVGNVVNMEGVFFKAAAFNQPVGAWDVSKVKTMEQIFDQASSFNQDISLWNVSAATNLSFMFFKALAFNLPIGSWNVSSATTMQQMFEGASAFNQDISSWDVSKVTEMRWMFFNAAAFNQNLGGWCVSLIPARPTGFDSGAAAWTLSRPAWGTCPAP
jgi:surface protein